MSEARQRRLARAVGRSIGAQRERAGLTQDQVSEMLGIGSQAVSRMERGAVMPTLPRLFEFADVFHCRVDELLAPASDRGVDQAALIARDVGRLGERDRELVVGVVRLLVETAVALSADETPSPMRRQAAFPLPSA